LTFKIIASAFRLLPSAFYLLPEVPKDAYTGPTGDVVFDLVVEIKF